MHCQRSPIAYVTVLFTVTLMLLFTGCDTLQDTSPTATEPQTEAEALSKRGPSARGRIVIADRASGTISVIDTHTDEVAATVPLPGTDAEPMYVVYVAARHRVFVGDRANNQVVAFNARTFEVEGVVPAGDGIFHMWADPQGKQLWVVDDINNVITVIDPKRLTVVATVDVEGGVPHDVILDPVGRFAFVSIFVAGGADQVVKYSTATFEEVGRADVGEDPHLSLARQNDRLYVPSQNSNAVFVLNRRTLDLVTTIDVPGAHGAAMTRNGRVFYTTNLPGGGGDALFAIDVRRNAVIGEPTDAPYTVPHNLALTPNGKKLYVTHSGPNNTVSVYTMSIQNPAPVFSTTVTVGVNPFGLAYVP